MSAPGEISRLSRAFEPDVAAITLVAARAPGVLRARSTPLRRPTAEILEGLEAGGHVRRQRRRSPDRGDRRAPPRAGRPVRRGAAARRHGRGGRRRATTAAASAWRRRRAKRRSRLNVPGPHQVANFLAACGRGDRGGSAGGRLRRGGRQPRPAAHRGESSATARERFSTTTPTTRARLRCARRSTRSKLLPGKREDRGARRHARARRRGSEVAPGDRAATPRRGPIASSASDRAPACIGEGAVEAGLPRRSGRATSTSPEQAADLLDAHARAGRRRPLQGIARASGSTRVALRARS